MIRGHGTDCMPTANVRYGRPKGSGLDDSQQLESVAALLAANPKLKPTTAIRSLGVEDPSTIRRLREKFRVEQARLMADARRSGSVGGTLAPCVGSNENTPAPSLLRSVAQRHRRVPETLCAPSRHRLHCCRIFRLGADGARRRHRHPSHLHAVLARPAGRRRDNARSARARRGRRRRLLEKQDAPLFPPLRRPLTCLR